MAHPVGVFFKHGQRAFTGEGKMARIIAQPDISRVGIGQHPIGLLRGLHYGAHVVVEAQLKATLLRRLAQLVEPFAEGVPLRIRHHMLGVAQNRGIHLPLDGVALLGHVDPVGAHSGQEIQLLQKLRLYLFIRLGQQKA